MHVSMLILTNELIRAHIYVWVHICAPHMHTLTCEHIPVCFQRVLHMHSCTHLFMHVCSSHIHITYIFTSMFTCLHLHVYACTHSTTRGSKANQVKLWVLRTLKGARRSSYCQLSTQEAEAGGPQVQGLCGLPNSLGEEPFHEVKSKTRAGVWLGATAPAGMRKAVGSILSSETNKQASKK